jgi:hypothetical protein
VNILNLFYLGGAVVYLSIVSKNGKRVTQQIKDEVFENKEQSNRFWAWAWEAVSYAEAKARIEKLGFEVRENNDAPETISRFGIWRRVNPEKRKPELIEFEGMMLKIRVS